MVRDFNGVKRRSFGYMSVHAEGPIITVKCAVVCSYTIYLQIKHVFFLCHHLCMQKCPFLKLCMSISIITYVSAVQSDAIEIPLDEVLDGEDPR